MTVKSFTEKREHRRLGIRLPFEFKKSGSVGTTSFRTMTVNVSTGGVYFETTADFQKGDKLLVHLGVPQDDERFPQESKIATVGQVVRVTQINNKPNADGITFPRYGVAAEFQRGFELSF